MRVMRCIEMLVWLGVVCPGLAQVSVGARRVPVGAPAEARLVVPAANLCNSRYDQFYASEPGVYMYWAFCEPGGKVLPGDDTAQNGAGTRPFLNGYGQAYGIPKLEAVPGPVPDGERAQRAASANQRMQNEGTEVNGRAGVIAFWVNADATEQLIPAVSLRAWPQGTKSSVAVSLKRVGTGVTFYGFFVNREGKAFGVPAAGYRPDTWHRVAMRWNWGTLDLFVDGVLKGTTKYEGALDLAPFFYQAFPGCCDTGKQMTLAKIAVANEAWSTAQVAADFRPDLSAITPVPGGAVVTSTPLGTIHDGVLGYASAGSMIADRTAREALIKGLTTAGVRSVRYAPGAGGIDADRMDWRYGTSVAGNEGGVACNQDGTQARARNASESRAKAVYGFSGIAAGDTVDRYFTEALRKLPQHVDVDYTVNYGSNPPLCTGGGDATVNGGALATYLNATRHYGVHRYGIGNEQWAIHSPVDLHPNAGYSNVFGARSTYVEHEPAFYDAIHAADAKAQVCVPMSVVGPYGLLVNYSYPLLATRKFDCLDVHGYPVQDPVSEGATLYQRRLAAGTGIRNYLLQQQTGALGAGLSAEAIDFSEWDGAVGGGKWNRQQMSLIEVLFSVTQIAEYTRAGLQNAMLWAQGNGDGCSTDNYDPSGEHEWVWFQERCSTHALVYTGEHGVTNDLSPAIGMKLGDLYPVGRGFQLLAESGFVTEGEHSLLSFSDEEGAPWLDVYGATHPGGEAVILINKDLLEHTVPVRMAGLREWSSAVETSYGEDQYNWTAIGRWDVGPAVVKLGAGSGEAKVRLRPMSANVVVFRR